MNTERNPLDVIQDLLPELRYEDDLHHALECLDLVHLCSADDRSDQDTVTYVHVTPELRDELGTPGGVLLGERRDRSAAFRNGELQWVTETADLDTGTLWLRASTNDPNVLGLVRVPDQLLRLTLAAHEKRLLIRFPPGALNVPAAHDLPRRIDVHFHDGAVYEKLGYEPDLKFVELQVTSGGQRYAAVYLLAADDEAHRLSQNDCFEEEWPEERTSPGYIHERSSVWLRQLTPAADAACVHYARVPTWLFNQAITEAYRRVTQGRTEAFTTLAPAETLRAAQTD